MNAYYLIARNREDNTFTVVELKETWYLGNENGREGISNCVNELEAIDLVTTRFNNEREMAKRMASHGYIPDSNVDIFVASKKEYDGRSYIKFDEVLYNTDTERTDAIRRIAQTSLFGNFKEASSDLFSIYDKAIFLAYSSDDYLAMLLDGGTNVPKYFAEQLRLIGENTDVPYCLKDSADFGARDYVTIRNIVESIDRLECLGCSDRDDKYILNDEFIEANIGKRMALVPELAVCLDKDYVEGQLSFFSLIDEESKKKIGTSAEEIVAEEKTISAKIKVDRSLDNEAKRKTIYKVLRNLPRSTFYRVRGTDEFKVNLDLFSHYPISEDEAKKLITYLTGKLPKYFAMYMRDYGMLCDANNDEFTSLSEKSELQADVEYDIKRIDNRFKSSKCLNMAYEWCMVMDGALKRDKAVSEGAKVVTETEDKAKVYEKKQQPSE